MIVARGGRRALGRAFVAVLLVGGLLAAAHASDPGDDGAPTPIEVGETVKVTLGGPKAPEARTFRLSLAQDVPGLILTCAGPVGEDFYVYVVRGEAPAQGEEDAEWFGVTTGATETIHLGGEGGLPRGIYSIGVRAVTATAATEATVSLRAMDGASRCACCGTEPPPALAPGVWTVGRILAKVAPIAWYAIESPAKASTLEVQVIEAGSDLDLVVANPKTGAVLVRSMGEQVDEGLKTDVARLAPGGGRLWLGVVDRTFGEDDVPYRIAVAFDGPPALPADLRLPPYPRPAEYGGLDAAVDAVVEITTAHGGGSGTCITASGMILTCRHVLEGEKPSDPLTERGILIAFPDDVRRPPRQTHKAVLLEADELLDLALLQIEGDVYGRPLATAPHLPFLGWVPGAQPKLGEAVMGLGFPEAGSEHARTGIIVTRGVVSGLESGPAPDFLLDWIKTDAWIGPGHSGGALVDGEFHLRGVVAATLGANRGLGLVRPVSRLPSAWVARLNADRIKALPTHDQGR